MRTMYRLCTLLSALLICGCAQHAIHPDIKVRQDHGDSTTSGYRPAQYGGDGTLRQLKNAPLGYHGYVIEFDRFDLGEAFDKEYHFENLLSIPEGLAEIVLAVEDEDISGVALNDGLRKKLSANLTITLKDSIPVVRSEFSDNLGNLVWSLPVYGDTGLRLYDRPHSFFTARPEEKYSLRVRYVPDALLRGKHGRICLANYRVSQTPRF